MIDSVEVDGAEQLRRVAHAVRAADDKALKKKFYAGMNRAVKPLRAAAKAGAGRLPARGGLAARVAKTKLRVSRRTGADAGIRILALPGAVADPKSIDGGQVRHPTYGHAPSVVQQVAPGWFTAALEAEAPAVRVELVRVLDEVAEEIASAAG